MIDLGCMDIDVDCLTKVGRKQMADRVFYAQVDASDSGFLLIVRLIDVTKGEAVRDREVPVVDQAGLREALMKEIVATFGAPPAPKPKKGRLIIETDAGAKIYIDGQLAGSGRVALKKPPGLYVVRVEKPGFENALFRVDLEAGKTERKVAELKAVPPPEPVKAAEATKPAEEAEVTEPDSESAESVPFYESWWFWTTIGAVVVSATTVGIVAGSDSPAVPTGDVQISVDPTSVWRDVSIRAGRTP